MIDKAEEAGERLVVVLDIGKTTAKLTLWTRGGELVSRETRANARIDAGAYAALDVDGIEAWMADTLADFAKRGRVGAIVPVAHGAAAAIIRSGRLGCSPMDYEDPITEAERVGYDRERGSFSETGSPPLPDGLNLGVQLHRLERLHTELLSGDALILPWAQYWAWRLSGVAATEITSLGCHTDLWNPFAGAPSRLARARGWADRLPPLRRAADALGPITSEWVDRCGLPADVRIHCGLHDTNAALLAARGFSEISGQESTVLSTGTWFVAMRSLGHERANDSSVLSEARDCLVNVDVSGKRVPSARFMGGREIETLTGFDVRRIDIAPDQPALLAAARTVLAGGARVLPTFAPGCGPFSGRRGQWIDMPLDNAEHRAAVSLYAALVADASLDLIGARERVLVEGRFADADVFVRALAALRPNDVTYRSHAHNGVPFGALRLLDPTLKPPSALERIEPLDGPVNAYRDVWRRDVERTEFAA
ncbi:MAG TPA: carbohydrate kinase [Sphingomonadaceae bacterium]|jgi:sugar (pentulose or hexulose) kinase|nr:carbohydrate kinase [Sphingomonadaceae bacterium]